MQEYARQYYHFEAAFPRFLSALHHRAESPSIRQLLLENLWDEEHGPRNHVALWLEFAAAIGVSRAAVVAGKPNAETSALIDAFSEACRNGPPGEALAMLYAYEGQVPAIAWEKIKGLSEHYGLKPDQFEFFSVHLVSDVAHAGAEMQAIAELAIEEDAVVAAAAKSCDLLWRFLDGCYRPAPAARN
jgi:pyrroloquinoline-quinone synthase